MDYCRKLKFEDKPDYKLLRRYFADCFDRLNFDHDYYYDWILKKHSLSSQTDANGQCNALPRSKVRGPLNRARKERED